MFKYKSDLKKISTKSNIQVRDNCAHKDKYCPKLMMLI